MRRLAHIAATAALLVLLASGASSCGDDSCRDNGSSLPLAACYVGSSQQTVTGLTIMGIGVPGDSLLLDSATVNEVYLPLRASTTSTSFRLRRAVTANGVTTFYNDTLTLEYQSIEFFHSVECGAMFNFDVEHVSCTDHGIDSVVLVNNLITNSRRPALRIYFAP